jgi:hypothetical protein
LKEAAPVYARFVTDGGDMTAHFWKWMHGEDPKTASRAYIANARALPARIDTLTGERRRAAEAFLLDKPNGVRGRLRLSGSNREADLASWQTRVASWRPA